MTKSNSAMGLRDRTKAGLTAKRAAAWGRRAGTTLVEILVVIVIFLIGILAVVQVFPRGFRLLLTTRNNSVATALGREQMERLKSSPDELPEEVVPVQYVGGVARVNPTIDPLALGPLGDSIGADGRLTRGGADGINWQLASGPNIARHIVGEGHRLPAPRFLGNVNDAPANKAEAYGSLLVVSHGPIDPNLGGNRLPNILAYGNDLSRTLGAPRETRAATAADGVTDTAVQLSTYNRETNTTTPIAGGDKVITPVSVAPYEFFVVESGTPNAAILVPALQNLSRTYRVRMSAYVGNSGTYQRIDYLALNVTVPPVPEATPGNPVSLVRVPLAGLVANSPEVSIGGNILAAVEAESVRVAPQYINVDDPRRPSYLKGVWTSAARLPGDTTGNYTPTDPFEYKVRDPYLGALLFSPANREGVVNRPGGVSEPLLARVDYDVRDWRIIGEDFRVVNDDGTFAMSLQSLKVGSNAGPDGQPNNGLMGGTNAWDPTPSPRDNVVVVDLTTGYEVQRAASTKADGSRVYADVDTNTEPTAIYMTVDKSRGSLTLRDANPQTPGVLDVRLIPPTGNPIVVPANNRTFRVFYRAREEWAVQVLKGAAQYSVVTAMPGLLAPGQAYIPAGTSVGSIQFAKSEIGRKVTIDRIACRVGGVPQLLEGQDFTIQPPRANEDSFGYVRLDDVFGTNAGAVLDYTYGTPVRGVKGASVTVRVLWNPETFSLVTNGQTNIDRLGEWGRGWRKSVTETYLRGEESR